MTDRGDQRGEQNPAGGGRAGEPTVGVIGLGAIGDGVATSVLRAGFPLVVCDVRPEATAAYADGRRWRPHRPTWWPAPTWWWWPWSTTRRSTVC